MVSKAQRGQGEWSGVEVLCETSIKWRGWTQPGEGHKVQAEEDHRGCKQNVQLELEMRCRGEICLSLSTCFNLPMPFSLLAPSFSLLLLSLYHPLLGAAPS